MSLTAPDTFLRLPDISCSSADQLAEVYPTIPSGENLKAKRATRKASTGTNRLRWRSRDNVFSPSHTATWKQSEWSVLFPQPWPRCPDDFLRRLSSSLRVTLSVAQSRSLTIRPYSPHSSDQELEVVARDWTKPPPEAIFSLRVPTEFASLHASVSVAFILRDDLSLTPQNSGWFQGLTSMCVICDHLPEGQRADFILLPRVRNTCS